MRKSILTTAVLAALVAPMISYADEAPAAAAEPTPTWTFPASVSLVSDYIWHGQTQTWGKPALQAGIEVDHASGFYAGLWASNVSSHWLPHAHLETDWSAGYRGAFATDFKYDIGGTYVYYPRGNFNKAPIGGNPNVYTDSRLNTIELYASLNYKWFTVKGGFNPTAFYGWNTNNSGVSAANPPNGQSFNGDASAGINVNGNTHGSGYIMASAAYDVMEGLTVSGELGHQMVADSTNLDWTWWKLGVTKALPYGFSVNAFYTDASGTNAYKDFISFDNLNDKKTIDRSKLVIGVSKSF